jgi:hypothetical protein
VDWNLWLCNGVASADLQLLIIKSNYLEELGAIIDKHQGIVGKDHSITALNWSRKLIKVLVVIEQSEQPITLTKGRVGNNRHC